MSASAAAVSQQDGFVSFYGKLRDSVQAFSIIATMGALVGAAVSKIFLTLAWTGGALAGAAAMTTGAFVFVVGTVVAGEGASDGATVAVMVASVVVAPIGALAACAAAGIRMTAVQATLISANSIAAFMSLLPAKGK